MKRCKWCNNNPKYIDYHDNEWGQPNLNDSYLFEMLILESFQAGLSWECVLNKRENFRSAFVNFDPLAVSKFDKNTVEKLCNNRGIIRNRAKINSTITNAQIFLQIQQEFGSFANFLIKFCGKNTIYEIGLTQSKLSNTISLELKKRGMKFVGSTIIYAYLQAVGIIYAHDFDCFLHKKRK